MTIQRQRLVALLQLFLVILSVLVPKHVCTCKLIDSPCQHFAYCNGITFEEHCCYQDTSSVIRQEATTASAVVRTHSQHEHTHCPFCECRSARLTAILATSFIDRQVPHWHFVVNANNGFGMSRCNLRSFAVDHQRIRASSASSGLLRLRM